MNTNTPVDYMREHEEFVIATICRGEIADCFNEVIDENGIDIPLFNRDDERLTADICRHVAARWGIIADEDYDEEERGDAQRAVMKELLTAYFKC